MVMGPGLLKGLHAVFDAGLTELSIEPLLCSTGWVPSAAFFQVLPGALPQLRKLMLGYSGLVEQAPAAAALTLMCAQLQHQRRPFELVFREPQDVHDSSLGEVVDQLKAMQPLMLPLVHVWIEL